ncbi:phytoene desaturase family protein [Micromonospora sp. WMMD729]|uniref:phytoene desaturase family protein n=1 Tax=Micromonospora sp. WMMD729 TaxID=3404127 RepID=UPI003BF5CBC2
MSTGGYDAVVVGAGHNGLVAANLLADAGWHVLVLEADDAPGGAVRSAEVLGPGFTTDLFSAFYPLGAASPVLRALDLERHGLRWSHAPVPLAHLLPDGRAVVLSRDVAETAASVERFASGDGAAWEALAQRWDRYGDDVLQALFSPFPPLRSGVRLLTRMGPADALRAARFATLPVRRLGMEQFRGDGARLLLAGTALHSDMSPDEPGSGLFGWLMTMVGQRTGFPVPRGGSGKLVEALVRRLRAAGGELRCGVRVEKIIVVGGRARGVVTSAGRILARRAVIADVDVPTLYLGLVGAERLPDRVLSDLRRFDWDPATLKLNWALSGPVPWTAGEVAGAGTVHLGEGLDGLTDYAADLTVGRAPRRPFLLLGQMTTADATRSPAGTEVVWAYTHLPRGVDFDPGVVRRQVAAVENLVERHAPGFRERVLNRVVQTPANLADADGNLVGGAINGGTTKIYQELVFRPLPGLGRAETPVRGLYLGSAGAHPGGGVHGGPGANAAKAALLHAGGHRLRAAAVRATVRRISGAPDRGLLPPPVSDLPEATNRGGAVGGAGTTGDD